MEGGRQGRAGLSLRTHVVRHDRIHLIALFQESRFERGREGRGKGTERGIRGDVAMDMDFT